MPPMLSPGVRGTHFEGKAVRLPLDPYVPSDLLTYPVDGVAEPSLTY